MQRSEMCEVCGETVAADDAVRTELSVGVLMCPTPLTMHRACFEQTASVFGSPPGDESSCSVDPDFPETAHWLAVSERSVRHSTD